MSDAIPAVNARERNLARSLSSQDWVSCNTLTENSEYYANKKAGYRFIARSLSVIRLIPVAKFSCEELASSEGTVYEGFL